MRAPAWTGLLCLALLGCEQAPAPRRPALAPPPAAIPGDLAGRYELWVGRRTEGRDDPAARWCHLELGSDGQTLTGRAWREGAELACVDARFTPSGQVVLRVRRELLELPAPAPRGPAPQPVLAARPPLDAQEAPEGERVVEEWLLEGRFTSTLRAPADPAEEQEDAAEPTFLIEGQATVSRGARRWTTTFSAESRGEVD